MVRDAPCSPASRRARPRRPFRRSPSARPRRVHDGPCASGLNRPGNAGGSARRGYVDEPNTALVSGTNQTQGRRERGSEIYSVGGNRPPTPDPQRDPLDANETNWTFVGVEGVGDVKKPQVSRLGALANADRCRGYCGRAADAATNVRAIAERERALAVRGRCCSTLWDTPLPYRDQRRFPLTYSSTSSPAQASRPSWMAKAAMTNPATGSSQAAPVSWNSPTPSRVETLSNTQILVWAASARMRLL